MFTGATVTRKKKKRNSLYCLSLELFACIYLVHRNLWVSFTVESLILFHSWKASVWFDNAEGAESFALLNEAPTAASVSDKGPCHKQAYAI